MKSVTASAPGRCGIIGNPSDIYGGVVVSSSVEARATCTLTLGEGESLPEDTRLWDAAIARFPLSGVRVEWSTTVPRSSGLSGSTALMAATLACVMALRGEAPDLSSPDGLMAFNELVRDVEYNEAKVICGYQDALMIVHGGLQCMDFAGKHPAVQGGPWPTVRSLDAPLPFLLVTTGVERLSGSVHGPIRERWLAGEKSVIAAIARVRELGLLGAAALEAQDWPALAELMTENQAFTASIGGSGEAIDALIADCISCGALSAKLAGAGMGGTVIALSSDLVGLESSLRAKGYTRFLRPCAGPGVRFEG